MALKPTLAERIEQGMVGLWNINPPYYPFFDDPREAEQYDASPVWDGDRKAYRFADGSYGRFEQCRDEEGSLLWHRPTSRVGMDASEPLPQWTFVALEETA
jgi:hypothetical protein